GRVVAFQSDATNLADTADTNGATDVFVRGTDPADVGNKDITGDGTVNDTVLEMLDASTGVVTPLCPAEQFVAAGGSAAFLRPFGGATPNLPACPALSAGEGNNTIQLALRSGVIQDLVIIASGPIYPSPSPLALAAQCAGGDRTGQ